ncbi:MULTISPECIES: biopolymer transporter ExbD [Delftia]|uniref:Biopolymer transporter ExbD n=2 Tax=Delftia TaxID=80865 RepID=A0A7T2S7P9_DELAC|nr:MULTISPECIES: biopolymer transporter ExbD [Delftia]MBB1647883.1 protein TolR [Delftia sp. UME58]MBL8353846.1 biopolymer transporter ExbD [Delftia acidovorans]QPS10456.1 biopolymer transporter ExbD [Delftia acidovorans]
MPAVASRGGRSRRTVNEINMVPFIDVMLVLLIIFMVTAPMLTPGSINVPSAGKAARTPPKRADVMIDKDGGIRIKAGNLDKTVTLKELGTAARDWQSQQSDDSAVLISADKKLPFETVMAAMSALQSAGVKRVAFGVKSSQ